MRFIRKLKRSTRQYIIVALICIIVIGSAAITTSVITIGQIREEYENMLNEAREEMNENKKTIYVAATDIKTGEILSEDKVEKRLVYSSQPIQSYITGDEIGKAVIIDIPEGTHILKGMIAQNPVSSVLREAEYDVIHISSNIEAGDFVDVRIFYPDGENFIVLSKKQIKGYQPDTAVCYMWVDEEELLRMAAAIVDAALYEGSKIYMTKYIEPNIQEASIITYTPSISVLSLIEHDPNIVDRCSQILNKEVRKALENRLAESMDLDVKIKHWDIEGDVLYMPDYTGKTIDDIGGTTNGAVYNKTAEIIGFNSEENLDMDMEANNNENKGDNTEYNEEHSTDIINTTDSKQDTDTDFDANMTEHKNKLNEDKEKDFINNPELGQLYDEDYFVATEG